MDAEAIKSRAKIPISVYGETISISRPGTDVFNPNTQVVTPGTPTVATPKAFVKYPTKSNNAEQGKVDYDIVFYVDPDEVSFEPTLGDSITDAKGVKFKVLKTVPYRVQGVFVLHKIQCIN